MGEDYRQMPLQRGWKLTERKRVWHPFRVAFNYSALTLLIIAFVLEPWATTSAFNNPDPAFVKVPPSWVTYRLWGNIALITVRLNKDAGTVFGRLEANELIFLQLGRRGKPRVLHTMFVGLSGFSGDIGVCYTVKLTHLTAKIDSFHSATRNGVKGLDIRLACSMECQKETGFLYAKGVNTHLIGPLYVDVFIASRRKSSGSSRD